VRAARLARGESGSHQTRESPDGSRAVTVAGNVSYPVPAETLAAIRRAGGVERLRRTTPSLSTKQPKTAAGAPTRIRRRRLRAGTSRAEVEERIAVALTGHPHTCATPGERCRSLAPKPAAWPSSGVVRVRGFAVGGPAQPKGGTLAYIIPSTASPLPAVRNWHEAVRERLRTRACRTSPAPRAPIDQAS
jgi:hypothetical protein